MTTFRRVMCGASPTSFGVFEYTATSKITIEDDALFGDATILTHIYSGGVGKIICNNPITSIQGKLTFQNNKTITSISIPSSVSEMSCYFSNCPNLTRVNISELSAWLDINFNNAWSNPLNEGAKLYVNGEELTELIINQSVKPYAFYGTSSLTTVSISDNTSPISIGHGAFSHCSALNTVTLNNVEYWGDHCFNNIAASTILHNGDMHLTYFGANYNQKATLEVLGDIETVAGKTFGTGCFNNMIVHGNVHLAEGIQLGGASNSGNISAFQNCVLNSVTVSSLSLPYGSFEGSTIETVNITDFLSWMAFTVRNAIYPDLFINNTKTLLIEGTVREDLIIPDNITSITDGILMDFLSIKAVKVLGNIENIGIAPFDGCTNLEYIDLSSQITVPTLSEYKSWKYGNITTIVPDALYDEWIAATNWSTYASYIIKKSDWDASQTTE